MDEVLAVMRSEIDMARDRRMLRRLAAVLAAGLILTIAAVAGLTFAVVALSKDTASSGGALVDKVTGSPLATSTVMFSMPLPDAWQATGAAMRAVHNATSLTIEEGDGSSTTYQVATVRLVPNVSATFITTDNTTFVADAEGVRFSKAGAPWQKHTHSDPTTKCS